MSDSGARRDPKRRDEAPVEVDDRSPYEAPAIKWVESFDKEATLAAACGKAHPGQGANCVVAQTS
jgi:hypothetical protein